MNDHQIFTALNWFTAVFVFLAGIVVGLILAEMFLPRGKSRMNETRERMTVSRLRLSAQTLNDLADSFEGKESPMGADSGEGEADGKR